MAGVLVHAADPLQGTPSQLEADHFSYVGQLAMNGCQNNSTPYSCASNGCNYPGNPMSPEMPTMAALRSWITSYQNAGLFAGLWGVTYNNPEAEAHCMAEVANALHQSGATPTFLIVDGEKSYETNQGYSQRFVGELNGTLSFTLAKGYTPECHNAVPFSVWLNAGFGSIQPQAYWDDVGLDPNYCLDFMYAYGVPKANAQLMFDGYRHFTPHTAADYGAEMKSRGAVGFSIWRTLAANEWDAWKPVIETGVATWPGTTPPPPPPPPNCGYAGPNTTLASGQSITSCDGRFHLDMQSSDGNLVLYMGGTPLWANHVLGKPGAWAIMQGDGNFVEYTAQGAVPLWSSHTYGHAGAHLAVQNDGNVVVYGPGGAPLWSTGTYGH